MSLPAHLLRQLRLTLRTDATRRRASDKRSAPRVGLRHPVRLHPTGNHDPLPAWIRNLSADGIGLLAKRPLPPGTEFVLPFDRPDGAPPLRILYRVTHLATVAPDLFAVGARFICTAEPLPAAPRAAS